MKLLLLVTLLSAGATAFRINPQTRRQFGNVFQCNTNLTLPMTEYSLYGCYCDYGTRTNVLADLDKCCQTRDNCHNQVKKLENCKSLIDNLNIFYSYSCSGNEVTCRGRNNTCENLICNCDRQAAICFSQAPNNKERKDVHC